MKFTRAMRWFEYFKKRYRNIEVNTERNEARQDNPNIESLLPEYIDPREDTYKTVEDLKSVLTNAFAHKRIKNIALTGPYGSGKSSILKTLIEERQESWEILPISLATLRVDEVLNEEEETIEEREKREETLNRKIEYSILQQLIYREKAETIPYSRFRRIIHISSSQLRLYVGGTILFILAFFIAFEPTWGRIETLYQLFSWGKFSIFFDLLAVAYMLVAAGFIIQYCLRNYANSRLNKLSPHELEIELTENTSIFNRHLDEILYFFQATRYNIVIIEDLDRFGTPNIFLKLRELNLLLNASYAIGRHIVFIYAVKDDIFQDEDRTKFFDYILTVIPIINPSNSKVKLKHALEQRGFREGEISDNDLSEIAFFIQDMRILKNIANEYTQYRQQLCIGKLKLDYTRLLAMIVYKNYFPKDFAQLHRREGKIYECFSKKATFQQYALKEVEQKQQKLEQRKKEKGKEEHLQEKDLRSIFLFAMIKEIRSSISHIWLRENWQELSAIEEDKSLFNELKLQTLLICRVNGRREQYDFNYDDIDQQINYSKRLTLIQNDWVAIAKEELEIEKEKLRIANLNLRELLASYSIGATNEFKAIDLPPMMNVFLRLGYINEDYYDYISYFYEGMISISDRELLLSIKQHIPQAYDLHIDKVENFYKELSGDKFNHDAILNNDLLDYVAKHQQKAFIQMMSYIASETPPLQFLAQYYRLGQSQEKVFKYYITKHPLHSWDKIEKHGDTQERELLQEAWLRYSEGVSSQEGYALVQPWLDTNYEFLIKHKEGIGIKRCLELCATSSFTVISNEDKDLLEHVIKYNSYALTSHNLTIIVSYLTQETVTENMLNYTWCLKTKNTQVIGYVNDNLETTISLFQDGAKEETEEAILILLNNDSLTDEQKKDYLNNQSNKLSSYEGIKEEYYDIATELCLIEPTWKNVLDYYQGLSSLSSALITYLTTFADTLRTKPIKDLEQSLLQKLFEKIALEEKMPNDKVYLLLQIFRGFELDNLEIGDINTDRLRYLIQNKFIALSESNTEELKETVVFGDYIVKYIDRLIPIIDSSYFEREDTSRQLLLSKEVSETAKMKLLEFIPPEHLYASIEVANIACHLLSKVDSISLDSDTLYEIIKHSNITQERLNLAIAMLRATSDFEEIAEILSSLGGVYQEISKRGPRPLLDKNTEHEALLSLLKKQRFISSFRQESENKYRVYPSQNSD